MKKVMFLLLAALGSVLCNAQNITIIKTTDGKQYAVKTGNVEEQGFFEVESYSAPETIHDTIYIEKLVHDTIYIENGTVVNPPSIDPDVKMPYTHAIDLGLPSGTKWADMNVGADKPEGYGWHIAWGETTDKNVYYWNTYKWCNDDIGSMLTKYCTIYGYWDSSFGTSPDKKTTLDPEDDAATVNWGGKWRIPTDAEITELRNECTWMWETKNEVGGMRVTGPNGNSIFLPAAGDRNGGSLNNAGVDGCYWSSSLSENASDRAWLVLFLYGNVHRYGYTRESGYSVRPVCSK